MEKSLKGQFFVPQIPFERAVLNRLSYESSYRFLPSEVEISTEKKEAFYIGIVWTIISLVRKSPGNASFKNLLVRLNNPKSEKSGFNHFSLSTALGTLRDAGIVERVSRSKSRNTPWRLTAKFKAFLSGRGVLGWDEG